MDGYMDTNFFYRILFIYKESFNYSVVVLSGLYNWI